MERHGPSSAGSGRTTLIAQRNPRVAPIRTPVTQFEAEPDDGAWDARARDLPDDLYLDILRGTPELVLVFSEDLRCRFCSDSVRETSGYEPSLVVGEYLTRIVARDQHDEVIGAAQQALAIAGHGRTRSSSGPCTPTGGTRCRRAFVPCYTAASGT